MPKLRRGLFGTFAQGASLNNIVVGGSDTAAPLNLTKRLNIINSTRNVRDLRILDIGCGAGAFVDALCQLGACAQGIEYQDQKIEEWLARHPGDGRVRWGDAEKLDFGDETFDIVIMNEVLEHIPNDINALNEAFRVLKEGGIFFNFTPNRFYPLENHGYLQKNSARHVSGVRFPFLPWIPLPISRKLVTFWCRNYWPSELRRITVAAGFEIISHGFVWQTFENISQGKERLIHKFAKQARFVAGILENLPVTRTFGASQILISKK